ncbi:MAG: hypothetical protein NTX50_00670, partial [Candidatus Sumerlaeota bacterium]|nr:hypothetical protein [Candidatus Sumerlaeota bacterium]
MASNYERCVFINCPFDSEYQELFTAIIFTVINCGFVARCALEAGGSGSNRINKIEELVAQCRLGVHDLSRTGLDSQSGLPRFNMPLELGLFLGAKRYGDIKQRKKDLLILDRDKYQYQKFCSDISGKDIAAHDNQPQMMVKAIRNWLQSVQRSRTPPLPGGSALFERFRAFQEDIPSVCHERRLIPSELTFLDWCEIIENWILANPS